MNQSSEDKDQKRNYRLFFGISIPEEHSEQIGRYQKSIALNDLRWTTVNNLHITSLFIGNVFPSIAEQIRKIPPAPLSPFEVFTQSVEVKNRKNGLMWVKCKPTSEITELHNYLKEETGKIIRIEEDDRPYYPHITLARSRNKLSPEQIKEFETFTFLADHYILYRSVNSPKGLEYLELERYPLKKEKLH